VNNVSFVELGVILKNFDRETYRI